MVQAELESHVEIGYNRRKNMRIAALFSTVAMMSCVRVNKPREVQGATSATEQGPFQGGDVKKDTTWVSLIR